MTRLLILPLAALFACTPPSPADLLFGEGWDEDWGADGYQSNARGQMNGELPTIGEFETQDAEIAYLDDWGDDYKYMELHTTNASGWGMVGLSLNQDLEDGVETPIDPDEVYGCSGPEMGYAEFDEPPEEVTVTETVEEVDGVEFSSYTIRAVFQNGDTVEGEISPVRDGE